MQSSAEHRSPVSDHVGRRAVRYYGRTDQDQAHVAVADDGDQVLAHDSHQSEAEDDLRDRDRPARRHESADAPATVAGDEDVPTAEGEESVVCESPVCPGETRLLQNSRTKTSDNQFDDTDVARDDVCVSDSQ